MKECKIKLNQPINLEDIIIPEGTYKGYLDGPGGGWPVIIYKDEMYDFVSDDIDVEFIK